MIFSYEKYMTLKIFLKIKSIKMVDFGLYFVYNGLVRKIRVKPKSSSVPDGEALRLYTLR